MKVCSNCKLKKDDNEFHRKGLSLRDKCKDCSKEYHRKHYLENKEKYLNNASKHRKKRYDEIREFLDKEKSKPCHDCGKSYISFVMDFDHVRGEKLFNLSKASRNNRVSIEKLKKELAKCELVCANCHRIRTWNNHFANKNN